MFCIDLSNTYKQEINATSVDATGKKSAFSFTAIFKRLAQSELEAMAEKVSNEQSNSTAKQLVKDVLVGWEGINTSSGEVFPFNDENLETVLNVAGLTNVVLSSYLESVAVAKRKN